MLNYHAVMTYTNDFDSFIRSIDGIDLLYPNLTIVDNSINKPIKRRFNSSNVYIPTTHLTCSQCFNTAQDIARKNNADVLIMMHSDIEVTNKNKLKEFLEFTESKFKDKQINWGVIFSTYDSLAAFNMDTCDVIGSWDQNITHYPIDVDYYHRMRKYGFQIFNFGGDWVKHYPSATIRKNLMMDHVNLIHTNHCNNIYYEKKWGGGKDREQFFFPFNGQDLNKQYLSMINDPIYIQLLNSTNSTEGGFLVDQSEKGRLAQFSLVLNILNSVKPRRIIETGTHKYLFSYFLSHFIEGFELHTFDVNEQCLKSWELINNYTKHSFIKFHCGDSRQRLSEFNALGIDLAWIDGGHVYDVCLSDLNNCRRLKVPYVLVDDSKNIGEVQKSIESFLSEGDDYYKVKNPYWDYDDRGITVLRRIR